MATQTKTPQRGAARVAFIAKLEAVRADRAAGWSLIAIYERHELESAMSLSQFRRYMGRYVRVARDFICTSPPSGPAQSALAPPPSAAALSTEAVDLDAYSGRSVDLEQLARVHKQKGRQAP
jgi:hypothetical protein